MIVEDVMSKSLKTVTPETSMLKVVSMMSLYRLSGLPVVTDTNKLVGFISERDVFINLFPSLEDLMNNRASIDMGEAMTKYREVIGWQVDALMTKQVISIEPDQPILKAASTMISHKFRRIPVTVGDRLVGMLSLGDVHKAIYMANVTDEA